jgi:hypothetical protein
MEDLRLFLSVILTLTACSYKAEDPGLCKLNCDSAIIGGNDPGITFKLMTQPAAISCPANAAGSPLGDPIFVQFVMAEKYDDGSEAGGLRPVPNISIEPIVNGLRSDRPEDNPNVVINGTIFTPARYKGIITPKDNWCTDTCGVATLEIAAACPPVGATSELGVQVHSGANYSEVATFDISTQDLATP